MNVEYCDPRPHPKNLGLETRRLLIWVSNLEMMSFKSIWPLRVTELMAMQKPTKIPCDSAVDGDH